LKRGIKKRSKKAGLPPGTPVHIGEKSSDQTRISVMLYNDERTVEKEVVDPVHLEPLMREAGVLWVNVDAVHDVTMLERMAKLFGLHPLILEDIANTDQRPKFEDYGLHAFAVLKMLSYDDRARQIVSEQVSVVMGANFLLSFGEREGDIFDPIRERIRHGKGRIRKLGPDYLGYSLLDTIVDNYFIILEKLGEQIEAIEEQLLDDPSRNYMQELYRIKRELLFLRKSVWPLREVIAALQHSELELIKSETEIYFRDVYDHTVQVVDTVETYRDMLTGMLDVYLSSVSYRTNVVMRVLTVIATIFMPLTFLAGVWGMNFHFMPEIVQPWGYPAALGLMLALGLGMILYFKKKGWM
jgi:magnesium transporter